MVTIQLNNCTDCTSIPALVKSIDTKLAKIAKDQYNNIIYELNKNVSGEVAFDLLTYKQILYNRVCNPDYAIQFSIDRIASKIKILTHK
jgi:hypothetical protein